MHIIDVVDPYKLAKFRRNLTTSFRDMGVQSSESWTTIATGDHV